MNRQLVRLVTLADLPNVTIRVLPFTADLHPRMKGPFKVIEFGEFGDEPDQDIAFLEGPRGGLIIDDP